MTLKHKFVEFIPKNLDENTIYVSLEYSTAVHNCCCGCGNEVVTPLSPRDWYLTYNGEAISLNPSIGNWGFPCQSHYWIKNNEVKWAEKWSKEKIAAKRNYEFKKKSDFYNSKENLNTINNLIEESENKEVRLTLWQKIKNLFLIK